MPDGSKEYLNKRWYDYTGLPMEEAKGWGWKVSCERCKSQRRSHRNLDLWENFLPYAADGDARGEALTRNALGNPEGMARRILQPPKRAAFSKRPVPKRQRYPRTTCGVFSSVIESGIGHAPGKLGDVMDEI